MDVIVYLLVLVLSGLVIGALGRLALPGPDPLTIWQTILVGIAASFVAGLIWWAISATATAAASCCRWSAPWGSST